MGHILTCAPTGSGKGIGAVIPTLLEYPGSAIVLDIKGENYAVTHRARREMGHAVYLVDPFGVTGQATAGFNWLDRLDPSSPDVVGESATLAEMLVVPDPHAEQHWDEAARNLLQGVMIHVVSSHQEGERHIATVRRLLTGSEDDLMRTLAEMALSDAGFGLVARAANTFIAKSDKERSGVLSAAVKHTAFLDDPRIAAALARSDFNLADLKHRPMTVYVVLPPARLAAYSRFMRGFVGQALAGITASEFKAPAPVLFLLDEFAQLGHMKAIEDAVSLVRGYGAFFWIFVQDLSQLKGVYPRWQTFLANAAKQFFGTADYDTARYISDSLGQRTVQFTTASSSSSTNYSLHGGGSTGHSVGEQHTGRSLLMPDEVMALGPRRPIVLLSGEPPYVLDRINYLADPEYSGRFDRNPYH
jgi:type IV secretion system protein VirD4